jgi:hypothetical protein
MPGYVEAALHRFQHPEPSRPQHAPHEWIPPTYGSTTPQAARPLDDSPILPSEDIKRIQKVVGTLLYYARAIDSTMLVALNDISAEQSKATAHTAAKIVHLLNYCATHPNAVVRYHASDMILHIDSDASYLSLPEARSRAGGH